jgi:hypothetical protein
MVSPNVKIWTIELQREIFSQYRFLIQYGFAILTEPAPAGERRDLLFCLGELVC